MPILKDRAFHQHKTAIRWAFGREKWGKEEEKEEKEQEEEEEDEEEEEKVYYRGLCKKWVTQVEGLSSCLCSFTIKKNERWITFNF